MAAFILVVIGAVNWGLVGLFNFNLVEMLLSFMPILVTLVYVLVALSGVYLFATHMNDCMICSSSGKSKRK